MRCPVRCCAAPECMQGRCVWLGEYLPRQRWINAYAQSVALPGICSLVGYADGAVSLDPVLKEEME